MDKYNERLVKGKPDAKDLALVIASALVVLVGIYLIIFVTFSFGVLVLALGVFCVGSTFGNLSVEYEYTLTNGDIDIAKIIAMKKRKTIGSIKLGDILCMDKADSNKVTHDIQEGADTILRNYTQNDPEASYYAIYTGENNKKIISIFDFDEKCVEHMKFYLKTKSLV